MLKQMKNKINKWMVQHSVITYSRYVRDILGIFLLISILSGIILYKVASHMQIRQESKVLSSIEASYEIHMKAISDYYTGETSDPFQTAEYYGVIKATVFEAITAINRFMPLIMGDEYPFTVIDILAIIMTESTFNPNAISDKNAQGIMQIMDTKKYITKIDGVQDPFNVTCGVYGGLSCLKDKYDIWKDKDQAIMAYYGVVKKKDGTWDRTYLNKVNECRAVISKTIKGV